MKNVVNDSWVVNNWVVDVSICSLIHLLITPQHYVQCIGQRNLNFVFKIIENVVLT